MDSIRLMIRSAAWLSILTVLLVTLVPIGLRPTTGLSPNIERFCVMAAVGALFAAAYPRRFWLIVLTLSLAAAIVEPLQLLAAGRHPNFRDVAFKSLGAVIGVACGYAVALVTGMAKNPTRPAPEPFPRQARAISMAPGRTPRGRRSRRTTALRR